MKTSKIEKLLCLTLATALFASLSACGTGSGESSEQSGSKRETSKPTETVTIDFWHHYSAQSAENETLVNVLIPKFEEENEGYKINAVSHEWADLHDKIIISASSGTLPDVARLDIAWLPEFHSMNILVPLDRDIDDFASVASGLLDNALETAQIKGNYYALPLNTNTKILFVNKAALDDAGKAVPTTMDELADTAKELSGKNSDGQQVWGLNEPALAGWNVLPYIWSFGGDITDEAYTTASGYINSPETVKAVEMLKDLYSNDAMIGFNSGDIPMTDGFGTGRYLMLLDGPWKIAELEGSYADFAYETADVPSGTGGSVSVLGGEDIAMLTSADYGGAWAFMQFMTGSYSQEEMAKAGQIPVSKAALESDTVKDASFAPFLDAITTAKTRPPVASWSEIDSALEVAMTKIITQDADVQDMLDALALEIDVLLK